MYQVSPPSARAAVSSAATSAWAGPVREGEAAQAGDDQTAGEIGHVCLPVVPRSTSYGGRLTSQLLAC